jgi:hypothetical protein
MLNLKRFPVIRKMTKNTRVLINETYEMLPVNLLERNVVVA